MPRRRQGDARRLLRAPAGGAVHALGGRAARDPRDRHGRTPRRGAPRRCARTSRSACPAWLEFGALLNPLLNVSLPAEPGRRVPRRPGPARAAVRAGRWHPCGGGRERGHVVVMEDLHWMDEGSTALIGHLARRVDEARSCCFSRRGRRRRPRGLGRRGADASRPGRALRRRVTGHGARGTGGGGPSGGGRRGALREDQGQPALPRGGHPLAAGSRRAASGS